MIGLFFEDINFAADGGLYAELLENRSFEAIKSKGSPRNYVLKEDNLYAWHSINFGKSVTKTNDTLRCHFAQDTLVGHIASFKTVWLVDDDYGLGSLDGIQWADKILHHRFVVVLVQ